jgi:hypothetical protein
MQRIRHPDTLAHLGQFLPKGLIYAGLYLNQPKEKRRFRCQLKQAVPSPRNLWLH